MDIVVFALYGITELTKISMLGYLALSFSMQFELFMIILGNHDSKNPSIFHRHYVFLL